MKGLNGGLLVIKKEGYRFMGLFRYSRERVQFVSKAHVTLISRGESSGLPEMMKSIEMGRLIADKACDS